MREPKGEGAPRLVYVGPDGDVYRTSRGGPAKRLTCGWFDEESPERLHYAWPSFSPDGNSVACFGLRPGPTAEAALYAVDDDGVQMRQVWTGHQAMPICESWSHDSAHIALLFQRGGELTLDIADVARPGHSLEVERGAPLFWSWSPTASLLAVHVGGSQLVNESARLEVFSLETGFERIATLAPGEFRTPAWSPDGLRIAYLGAAKGHEFLGMYRIEDGVSEQVSRVDGHCALLWSPDGRKLAYSQALGDNPHLYVGITLVDVRTGKTDVISDNEVVGFFWSPCSERLASITIEEERGMRMTVFDLLGGTHASSSTFYPTDDFIYFIQFFDQFAASHPLISPDGGSIVFAGHTDREQAGKPGGESSVYVMPLAEGLATERVAAGHFACWESRPARARAAAR